MCRVTTQITLKRYNIQNTIDFNGFKVNQTISYGVLRVIDYLVENGKTSNNAKKEKRRILD